MRFALVSTMMVSALAGSSCAMAQSDGFSQRLEPSIPIPADNYTPDPPNASSPPATRVSPEPAQKSTVPSNQALTPTSRGNVNDLRAVINPASRSNSEQPTMSSNQRGQLEGRYDSNAPGPRTTVPSLSGRSTTNANLPVARTEQAQPLSRMRNSAFSTPGGSRNLEDIQDINRRLNRHRALSSIPRDQSQVLPPAPEPSGPIRLYSNAGLRNNEPQIDARSAASYDSIEASRRSVNLERSRVNNASQAALQRADAEIGVVGRVSSPTAVHSRTQPTSHRSGTQPSGNCPSDGIPGSKVTC